MNVSWKTLGVIALLIVSIVGFVSDLTTLDNELWNLFDFRDRANVSMSGTLNGEAPTTRPEGLKTQALLLATPTRLSISAPRPSATVAPTSTPLPTATPTLTPSPTTTPPLTPSSTATPTLTPSPTATPTLTPSPTATPTLTPSPTATPTLTPSPTAIPTVTPSPTAIPTVTPSPTPIRVPQPLPLRADAGFRQVVHPGDLVTLDASGSSPNATYRWEIGVTGVMGCDSDDVCFEYIRSQVTLSNPEGLMPRFIAPDLIQGATRYGIWFDLTVSRDGLSATDSVQIVVERPE